jgi:hypothetical protein
MQRVTRFGDETTLSAMGLIQSLGDLSEDGLKGATKAAMDMSAALKIDLTTAATLMGKAAAGEVGTLSRYGIAIERGANNAETFARVLDTVNSKFGGSAERDVKTYSGATEQLSNTWGDLLEKFGEAITTNGAVISIMGELDSLISGLTKNVSANMPKIKTFVAEAFSTFISFGVTATKALSAVIQALSKVVTGVRSFGQAISSGVKIGTANFGFLKDVVTKGFSEARKNWKQNIDEVGRDFNEGLIEIFEPQLVVESFGRLLDPMLDKASNFSERVKGMVGGSIATLPDMVPVAKLSVAPELSGDFDEETKNVLSSAKSLQDGLGQIFNQGISNTVAGGIQNIVTSLAQGENAFESFGKFLFGVLGDIAIQLGTTIIMSSKAIAALKLAVMSPFGGAAAAGLGAGIALVALGTLLKSLGGGGGSTGVPSSGPVQPVSEGGTGTFPTVTDQSVEDRGPQVTVNIQGNVLDRKESGLELVKVLNSAFKDQGLRLRGAA